MTHDGGYDPPAWYVPFVNLQAIARELYLSVPAAAAADPEWQRMARFKLAAEKLASERRKGASASD